MSLVLQIQDLKLSYSRKGKSIMEQVNLDFESGKIYAFLGENGIGKSTLLKAIAGVLPIDFGTIRLKNIAIDEWKRSELSKEIAIVLTESINHSLISVFDFVAYGRYPFTNWLGKLKEEDIKIIEQSISLCNATSLIKKSLSELSDGERQKVMIARALAQQTPIIILDEPTTHLDIRNTKAIFKLLNKLSVDYKKTILFSTHQLNAALEVADGLVIHSKSEVVMCSSKAYKEDKKLQYILTGE